MLDEQELNIPIKRTVVDYHGDIPKVDLPQGWIGLAHSSGGIVYIHTETRVVTWSRPYQISRRASVRKHDPPLVSIPCLHERLSKDTSKNTSKKRKLCPFAATEFGKTAKKIKCELSDDGDSNSSVEIQTPDGEGMKEDVKNSLKEFETVESEEVHDYLAKIFNFRDLTDEEWKTPLFSDETYNTSQTFADSKRKVTFKTEGKTPLQMIYEYAQKELKEAAVKFHKIEIEGLADFCSEVQIDGLKYGIAKGDTYKQAKHNASTTSLDILNPKLFSSKGSNNNLIYKKFDEIDIEDEKVIEIMAIKTEEVEDIPKPFEVLLKLLKKNFKDFDEDDLSVCHVFANDYMEYTINYKDYEATGTSTDMEEGEDVDEKLEWAKNLAAQKFIKKLYPILSSWGSVIRLSLQEIPTPKITTTGHRPNNKYMNALKDEMRKMTGSSS